MAQYSRVTLTDAGVVIARRMMDDDSLHLTFTGIASGDGQYSADENLAEKTALKSQKQFFPLSSKRVTDDQTVQLKYVISNINPDGTPLTAGYYVREVGIYAQIGSEAAVLYAIAVADADTADYLPEYNELQPSTIAMDWFLTVANTENISIAADSGAYALAEDLEHTINTLEECNTSERISIAISDWTASGSNFTCTKSCSKASTADDCVLRLVPVNPGTLTAAQLKLLHKNVAFLYPQPTVGDGTITFLASTQPTIALSFDVVGGSIS